MKRLYLIVEIESTDDIIQFLSGHEGSWFQILMMDDQTGTLPGKSKPTKTRPIKHKKKSAAEEAREQGVSVATIYNRRHKEKVSGKPQKTLKWKVQKNATRPDLV